MTPTTFNEVYKRRRTMQNRVEKAAFDVGGEEDLQRLVKEAQEGELSIQDAQVAVREIDVLLEDAGELPVRPTSEATKKGKAMLTTPKFANKAEVLEEANRLAEELIAKDPKLYLAQARAKVWEQNPELARQYKELPDAPAPGRRHPRSRFVKARRSSTR
jgi:hypothetical protein